jgi:uncharacterized protein
MTYDPMNRPLPVPADSLTEADIAELQTLLEAVPEPLEAMSVSMLDGYLCGVLVQPQWLSVTQWLPYVTDGEGQALPARFHAQRLHFLVMRRYNELKDLIGRRQWFDPWIFEELIDDEPNAGAAERLGGDDAGNSAWPLDAQHDPATQAVAPWVHGFAAAQELFPTLIERRDAAVTEPLALIFRHLAYEDLEDAEELWAEIESLEPPADLSEAVEALVRATLLLADLTPAPQPPSSHRPRRARS